MEGVLIDHTNKHGQKMLWKHTAIPPRSESRASQEESSKTTLVSKSWI